MHLRPLYGALSLCTLEWCSSPANVAAPGICGTWGTPDIPVAINTFGSYWRVNRALGTDNLESLAGRVQQLVKPEIPTTLIEKMKKLPDLIKMGSYPPKVVRSGICQQVVWEGEKADLTKLPIIQCWPLDGNLDSGQVFDQAACAAIGRLAAGKGSETAKRRDTTRSMLPSTTTAGSPKAIAAIAAAV